MDFLTLLLLVVVAWSVLNAVLAHQRGRGTIRWFLLSLLISPLIITIVGATAGRHGGQKYSPCPARNRIGQDRRYGRPPPHH
jgi:hypothetical protein